MYFNVTLSVSEYDSNDNEFVAVFVAFSAGIHRFFSAQRSCSEMKNQYFLCIK